MKKKEDVVVDFLNTVRKSWTWEKLDKKERELFTRSVIKIKFMPKGSYKNRWNVVNNYYEMFLKGCGYEDPTSWRIKF